MTEATASEIRVADLPLADGPHVAELRALGILLMGVSAAWFFVSWLEQSDAPGWRLNLAPCLSFAAGFGLLSASLRLASALRWVAVFALATLPFGATMGLLAQPWDLTRVQWHHQPRAFMEPALWLLAAAGLLVWVLRVTSADSVQAARVAAGRPRRRLWVPISLGLGLTVLATASLQWAVRGEWAHKAEAAVQQRIESSHRAAATRVSAVKNMGQGTWTVRVDVAVWNNDGWQVVPVQWQEP